MAALALLIGAAALSFLAVAYARRWALSHGIMDIPNARSSHSQPMPRAGGIGIVATFIVAFGVAAALNGGVSRAAWAVLGGGVAVATVGLVDDLRRLPASIRFGVHLAAACAAVIAGARVETLVVEPLGYLPLEQVGVVLSVLWLVAVTNIYNFMDGIDGIAAGVAVLAGAGMALLAAVRGDGTTMLLACAISGCALGFLGHNFPPARVFMGDVGSGFLGFVLAGIPLINAGTGPGTTPPVAACALLAPFLMDGTFTLIRRILAGERWYEAHRSHYYQRLVILGYPHRTVTLGYYALTLLVGLGALAYTLSPTLPGLVALILSGAAFLALPLMVSRMEARATRAAAG